MKQIDWMGLCKEGGVDALVGALLSSALLFLDGNAVLFWVSAAMTLALAFGLSIYRQRERRKRENLWGRYSVASAFGVFLGEPSSLSEALEKLRREGGSQAPLIEALNGDPCSLESFGRPGRLASSMLESFHNGKDEEISRCIQESVAEKKKGESAWEQRVAERKTGLALSLLSCLPLLFLPRITIVAENFLENDWLFLFLRLTTLLLFVGVEFFASRSPEEVA